MKQSTVQRAAIWSVAIWPALNFIAHNWTDVVNDGVAVLAGLALISLCLGALGYAFHYLMSKRDAGGFAVVCTVLGICLFFGYSLVHHVAAGLMSRLGLSMAPSLAWLLLVVIVAVPVIFLRRHEGLQVAATVFSFSATALALGQLAFIAFSRPQLRAEAPAIAAELPADAPPGAAGANVYYILLDEYAGQAGLQEFSGFDNRTFVGEMARRGFVDATAIGPGIAHSNYLVTQQALGAIFALDYSLTEDPRTWRQPWRLFPNLIDGAQAPALVRGFKSAGYSVWQTFNTWTGCSGRHLRCLGGQGSLNLDQVTMSFVAPTPLGRMVALSFGRREDGLAVIDDQLEAMVASKQSFFVFVHSLITHPPFYLGADCNTRDLDQSDVEGNRRNREAYIGALACANRRVIGLVDRIQRDDPNAIVVVQGDHGSELTIDWDMPIPRWPDSFIRERASFLNLIKAPPVCKLWLDRSIAQINTARFVLGCARRQKPQYLEDRTYLSSYSKVDGNYVIVPLESLN